MTTATEASRLAWAVSIVLRAVLANNKSVFGRWMIFSVPFEVALFVINWIRYPSPQVYSDLWGVYIMLAMGMVVMTTVSLTAVENFVWPVFITAVVVLLLHTPFLWPNDKLEFLFVIITTVTCFCGSLILFNTRKTWPARTLATWCLLTTLVYAVAAHYLKKIGLAANLVDVTMLGMWCSLCPEYTNFALNCKNT